LVVIWMAVEEEGTAAKMIFGGNMDGGSMG
jgi:hypothetical protein